VVGQHACARAYLQALLQDAGGVPLARMRVQELRKRDGEAGDGRPPPAGHVCGGDADSRQLALQRRRRRAEGRAGGLR
jgi:hypothetical protein